MNILCLLYFSEIDYLRSTCNPVDYLPIQSRIATKILTYIREMSTILNNFRQKSLGISYDTSVHIYTILKEDKP